MRLVQASVRPLWLPALFLLALGLASAQNAPAPSEVEVVRNVEYGKGAGHGFKTGDPDRPVAEFFDRALKGDGAGK